MNAPVVTQLPANPLVGMFTKAEEVGPPRSILIYGEPGTWKTMTVGRMIKLPQFTKMLYIDIDNGSEVFANDPEVFAAVGDDIGEPDEKRINIFQIDKRADDAWGKLQYLFSNRLDDAGNSLPPVALSLGYDVVVLDSLDVAQEVAVKWLTENTYSDKGVLNTQKAWGEVSIWTANLAWALQNTPNMTGVIVMHSKIEADTGKPKIKPKLQGSVKDSIDGIPSLVAYVEKKESEDGTEHIVATISKAAGVAAKNRYFMDKPIVDFSMEKLYGLIAERDRQTREAIEKARASKKKTTTNPAPAKAAA